MWLNPRETTDLITLTEEILKGKTDFFCSVHFFKLRWVNILNKVGALIVGQNISIWLLKCTKKCFPKLVIFRVFSRTILFHWSPSVPFRNRSFLIFSGGIERDQWHYGLMKVISNSRYPVRVDTQFPEQKVFWKSLISLRHISVVKLTFNIAIPQIHNTEVSSQCHTTETQRVTRLKPQRQYTNVLVTLF